MNLFRAPAWRRWLGLAALVISVGAIARPAAGVCACDCQGDGEVRINDLITAVRLALEIGDIADCTAADRNGDGRVLVDELIAGVRAALAGCPPESTATASATPTASLPPTASATATVSATATASATPTDTPRLNFLIINLDDTRYDGLDRMPVLQSRLLPQSVRFPNSFVPLASCCSSRASLLTGLYAVHHLTRQVAGTIGGAKALRQSRYDQRTIAVWLHDAGYATGLFGKYLNEYDKESDKGPGGTFYVPPGWTRWQAFSVEHYGGMAGPTYKLVDEHGGVVEYDKHDTDEQYSTDVTATLTRQFIADSAAAGQPFFAVWTPYASHGDGSSLSPLPAVEYLNVFAGIPLYRPPNWSEPDRSDKPRWAQELEVTPLLQAANDAVRERAYETLLSADHQLELLLDDLVALGIDDHTIVILTSDNGVAWGEHAQFFQAKGCPYEECLRVPFMLRLPGGAAPGEVVTPVLNIDIAPTVAALAGVEIPAAAGFLDPDGESLAPALSNRNDQFRDDFLLEQWRVARTATLNFSGQPLDGDQVRLFYGPDFPKASLLFEFDGGDGVSGGKIAVPIGDDANATYRSLGQAVVAAVPHGQAQRDTVNKRLTITDLDAAQNGFLWWIEVNESGNFSLPESAEAVPDFFGVRDVLDGYTYVQYETGEVELYDLNVDPWQLANVAADPGYAAVRDRLDARMRQLAGLP